jgi:hypothetical protein
MHGVAQGVIQGVSGGDFGQSFLTAAISSVAAGGYGMLGGATQTGVGQVLFGTIAGGVTSDLQGGNFWQGAVIGFTVSALNHVAHQGDGEDPPGGKKGKYYNKKPTHNSDIPLQEHYDDAVTLSEWSKANDGLTREQIINQRANRSSSPLNSQQGGPNLRYVFHPKTGNVIDMRHMLIMGNNGPLVGNMVEVGQQMAGLASGLNRQDFYSNSLGYGFYNTYNDTGVQLMRFLGVGTNFSSSINSYLNR